MTYSIDTAYLDYFNNAAIGIYDDNPLLNRVRATGIAAGTAIMGGVRAAGRVANLVVEVAKVIFYTLASTLSDYENINRLKDHTKLLTLNTAALVAQPLQVLIHLHAAIIGALSPVTAYRAMKIGSTPLAWITSQENTIWQQYDTPEVYTNVVEAITSKITHIFKNSTFLIQIVVKTVLNEFSAALDGVLVTPLGYLNQFHSFGTNPKTLSEQQKKMVPILLLNGNYTNQATFLPLLHALSGNERPVYTINLPPNMTQPSFISSKLEAIKNQYGKANDHLFEIDIIGHSMGSCLLQNMSAIPRAQQKVQIRLAITVGTPFALLELTNKPRAAFDIIGTEDRLIERKSLLSKEHQINIKAGHLGLLSHRDSLNAMIRLLETQVAS